MVKIPSHTNLTWSQQRNAADDFLNMLKMLVKKGSSNTRATHRISAGQDFNSLQPSEAYTVRQ